MKQKALTKNFCDDFKLKKTGGGGAGAVGKAACLDSQRLRIQTSDHKGSNFESCVWRAVSSHTSHHPQEVLLAQFSLYVHKDGLNLHSFHFYITSLLQMNRNIVHICVIYTNM